MNVLTTRRLERAIAHHNQTELVLGEIRDGVTADAAMTMAIQGERVYSTLHSQSCVAAIPRLENLGIQSKHRHAAEKIRAGLIDLAETERILGEFYEVGSVSQPSHAYRLAGCDTAHHSLPRGHYVK